MADVTLDTLDVFRPLCNHVVVYDVISLPPPCSCPLAASCKEERLRPEKKTMMQIIQSRGNIGRD